MRDALNVSEWCRVKAGLLRTAVAAGRSAIAFRRQRLAIEITEEWPRGDQKF